VLQTLTYIDRSNVSFAALQFKGDLHLTTEQFGLGAGKTGDEDTPYLIAQA
jgi:hypothetical protein